MSALRYTLVVRDPEGVAVALVAGSEVPEWAADLVHSDDLEPEVEPEPVEAEEVESVEAEEVESVEAEEVEPEPVEAQPAKRSK